MSTEPMSRRLVTAAARHGGPAPTAAGQLAWSSPAEYLRMAMGRSPIVVVLGALLTVESAVPGVPVAVPTSETVMGVLILGAVLRSGRLKAAVLPLVTVLLAASFLWMLAVTLSSGLDGTRRMIRIGMLFAFALMLATGRVPLRPLIFGMGIGLAVNAVLFYAGVAPDNYQGALSGYILDKNVAGFFYAVVPLLVVPFLRRRWLQLLVLAAGVALVFQTGSRTGLAAMILALGWMTLAGRGGPLLRGAVLVVFYYVFIWAEENLASLPVFGDRSGTDWFRGRIDAAAWVKTQQAMPWGEGAGQAFVLLPPEQQPFFFHNSYWALLVEGGIPLLVLVAGAFTVGAFGLGSGMRATPAVAAGQAAAIVILLVSFRLGEVFFTVPSMVVLGGAIALWEAERRRRRQERRYQAAISPGVGAQSPRSPGKGQWAAR